MKYLVNMTSINQGEVIGKYIEDFQYPENTIVLNWNKDYEPNQYIEINDGDLKCIETQISLKIFPPKITR